MGKRKRGRPTKLDDVREKLLVAHENGLDLEDCAFYVNIDPSTLRKWLRIGESAKRGKFHNFWIDWQKAHVKRELVLLRVCYDASQEKIDGDWKSARFLLETLNPKKYKPNVSLLAKMDTLSNIDLIVEENWAELKKAMGIDD